MTDALQLSARRQLLIWHVAAGSQLINTSCKRQICVKQYAKIMNAGRRLDGSTGS